MAQSSVKSFFPTRKRPAVGELKKVSNSPKALLLDDTAITATSKSEGGNQHKVKIVHVTPIESKTEQKLIRISHTHHSSSGSVTKAKVRKKLVYSDEATLKSSNLLKSFLKASEGEKVSCNQECSSPAPCVKDDPDLTDQSTSAVPPAVESAPLKDDADTAGPSTPTVPPVAERASIEDTSTIERPHTPENSPLTEEAVFGDLGLNDLKVKINRSKRYNALKDSLQRYQSRDARLKDIACRLQSPLFKAEPTVQEFSSFEIEVPVSPLKSPLKPQRLFNSPTKTPQKGLRRRLDYTSPVKPDVYVSPRKLLEEPPSPVKAVPCHLKFESLVNGDALILPFKYRTLLEIFCAVDTIASLFHNRKDKITFTKLKSGVQKMLRRNFTESHLAQIKTVLPEAFEFSQEKEQHQVLGKPTQVQYHLIIKPIIKSENNVLDMSSVMTPSVLAARKRQFNSSLLKITKQHHREFLLSLDPPLDIPMEKVTRWHAEFEVNTIPDIPLAELPLSPTQTQLSAKDVLENAKSLLKANSKVTAAIENLSKRLEGRADPETPSKPFPSFSVPCHSPKPSTSTAVEAMDAVSKALKGVPQSLLDKIKAKQAARAVEAMTRSPAQNKKAVMLSRLPEIARIVRSLFVVERKGVLPLDQVTVKLEDSCREKLTRSEIKSHLSLINEHTPEWLIMCLVRNIEYVKLLRTADFEAVMLKLNRLAESEQRIYHCR